MAKLQREDRNIEPLYRMKCDCRTLTLQEVETGSPETRHYLLISDNIVFHNDLLWRRHLLSCGESLDQLIAPTTLRKRIMGWNHDSLTSGHMGVKATEAEVSRSFYWFHMKTDVRLYVNACEICEADRKPPKKPKAPLGHLRAGAPWDILAMDYVGPFPVTPKGNRYILVATDVFTKYAEIWAVPSQTAEVCASIVLNDVIARWG
ncbi:MAG: transposase family protein, partial [Nitrospira sp.]|nr:transposase family protein [Nitrospira sp.]